MAAAQQESSRVSRFLLKFGRNLHSTWIPKLNQLSEGGVNDEIGPFLMSTSLAFILILLFPILYPLTFTLDQIIPNPIELYPFGPVDPSRVLERVRSVLEYSGAALLVWFVAGSLLIRVLVRARLRDASQASAQQVRDPAYRDVERIRSERASHEEQLFQRNLKDDFNLKAFEWSGISFFEDGGYRFASRVNVLLGKNGYGKTLLLRTLAALMQRNLEYSGLVFERSTRSASRESSRSDPLLRGEVTRNGDTEEILRDAVYFADSAVSRPVGKIPLLAIPDSRFVNRARRIVAGAASNSESLASSGAWHFITQEPYENVVQDLLTQLCLDYLEPVGARRGFWQRNQGFDRQIFRVVEEVVRELTEDKDFRFAKIERVGTSGFQILVHTTGSVNFPIPVQAASQGTLSIVAIFGLIYSFLHSLRPSLSDDEVSAATAIVLIDEIDAHLHPSWQQKILGMLTRTFPNVQFIVAAHSPVIVAGCDKGEVSVLRRRRETGAFYVDTLPQDFLGANARDLYRLLFEIEDIDRLYLEYTTKGMADRDEREREREIEWLESKQPRSQAEEEMLESLQRDQRLFDRAAKAREERLRSERGETQVAMLEAEVERLQHALRDKEREIERLTQVRREQGSGQDGKPTISG